MSTEMIEKAARVVCQEGAWCGDCDEPNYDECGQCRDTGTACARAVIAAIHPTVNSVDELDALPEDTIVMDELGIALRKTIVGWWADTGDNRMSSEHLADNSTSLTVLHVGGAA